MKNLSVTQKVLIGTGAVVLAAAATVGVITIVKKLKAAEEPIAVYEFDADEQTTDEAETEE